MKPTVQEDIEDDLQAEEENKVINEVCLDTIYHPFATHPNVFFDRNIKHGTLQSLRNTYASHATHRRKKNAPYLYDLVITHALDWPSLTCQWFPDKESCVCCL